MTSNLPKSQQLISTNFLFFSLMDLWVMCSSADLGWVRLGLALGCRSGLGLLHMSPFVAKSGAEEYWDMLLIEPITGVRRESGNTWCLLSPQKLTQCPFCPHPSAKKFAWLGLTSVCKGNIPQLQGGLAKSHGKEFDV